MEYKIIIGIGTGDLERRINELLEQGWKPQGGIASDGRAFFQAMIKEK